MRHLPVYIGTLADPEAVDVALPVEVAYACDADLARTEPHYRDAVIVEVSGVTA